MSETKIYTRPIIQHLNKIKGDDLFISGQCLLSPLNFSMFFIEGGNNRYRPIFLLKPDKDNEKLILIMDGDLKGLSSKRYLSQDKKTICFNNTLPLMYIFKTNIFKTETLREILRGYEVDESIYNQGLKKENEVCEKILEVGFIQPSVIEAIFTATFEHEKSKAGRFTLTLNY